MWEAYEQWVTANPLWSAAVQFGLLGTLGETLAVSLRSRALRPPGGLVRTLAKVMAWALLGIIIKYGFTGMRGFTAALQEHRLLPHFFSHGLGQAFAISVFTNLFFGPQMMLFHRLEDNLIAWRWSLRGLHRAWATLLWFWIPAHTLTFSLPAEYQIGLAAVWSIVLGVILGLTKSS